ncbi:MAG TPA: efflux RND transporter permease subunit [Vicinamibacterales bacterium]|nr:efflux RND transporter permease subunit [Vicinamibacterales bacterium]
MFLSNLSISRPVVATVMMLTLVTLGLFSWRRLPTDMMPEVEIPVLSVVAELPGASPETVEREVSKKIEEALNPMSGVKHVNSISRESLAMIIVEFDLEVEVDSASQEARAKINAIRRDLPANMGDPVIQKFDFQAMPVISVAVRSKTLSARELTTLADRRVKRRLEGVSGVARAKLIGDSTREVAVDLDPARLSALGMGVDEVVAGLASENVNTPLGRLTSAGSEIPLRISGKPASTDGYANMVIARRGGQPIRLADVATITDTIEEPRSLALIDGEPAVAIDITKQTKANTVGVVDGVLAELEALRAEMPAGVELQVVRDTSVFIREAVHDVQNTLILGGLLTILIVFCFLNSWRSTVITGLTLPISVISSFIVMYFLGMTLNMLTLMALSLAIGLLIDDAIVVRENIVRHLERGEDHFEAARKGTAEIGLAVLATTMSIIAVFVPVAFMKGVVGRFFYQFGLTVAFAVLVSLFVSFTLDPMLSSRWIDPDIERKGRRNVLQRALDRFNEWFERMADGYKRIIGWALDHRFVVSGVAVAAFVAGLGVFTLLQTEFMTPMDQGEFVVKFKSAPGSSIAETRGRVEEVLGALSEFEEVRYTYASIGAGDSDTVRDATVFVKLVSKDERERGLKDFVHDARLRLQKVPGIVLSVQEETDAFQKPLQVVLQGEDIATLKRYAAQVKHELYGIPGIVDIEATMELDLPEYRLIVDRERAAATGLGSAAVANTVGVLVGGQAVTTYEDEEGEGVAVRVRLPQDLRSQVSQIGDLKVTVPSAEGMALVPLSDLVTFTRATSPAEINRRDLSRQVTIDANLDKLALGTASNLALAAANKIEMAPGYKVVIGGDTEMMVESFGYMAEALLLAVILVYLILAAQFESFMDPLAIMFSLPLAVVGMAGTLVLTGDTINIMSLIGLIMLMGLVTKNAILLVDYTKVLRSQGLERREALVLAGRTRLRPILMTTSAMIFGMLPLFFAIGEGAEFRAPMARAVVGGLITSTALTLIVVPVVYSLLDDVTAWLLGRNRKKKVAAVATTALVVLALALTPSAALAQAPAAQGSSAGTALSTLREGMLAAGRPSAGLAGQAASAAQAVQPEAAIPVKTLTLEQALAIAAEQNRDILKAREYQHWVQGRYEQERAAALPRGSLSLSTTRTFDDSMTKLFKDFMPEEGVGGETGIGDIFGGRQDVGIAGFSVNQVVFTWGQVGAAIRAAKLGFGVADQQLRRFQQAVEKDVTTAFYDVLAARELATIARQDLEQRQRHLDETIKRQSAGTATDYDVLAARVAVENGRPAVIRAENGVRLAREQLRFLLAEPGEVDAAGALAATIEPPPPYEQVLASALENRPEVAELSGTKGIYGELVTIAKAANKPRVDFSASWGQRRLGLKTISARGTTWNAGLVATIPLFDGWRTKGAVAQAQSDLVRLNFDELKLRDGIRLEVRNALNAVREASEIVAALGGTVAQAEKLLFLAEKGFELGVKTRLEVQDAELNLSSARANLARAQRDYNVARVNLEWVAGTLGQ